MDEDVTEFTFLDPLELHLVGKGANGFSPLLAKAAKTVNDVVNENASTDCFSEDGVIKYVSAEARHKYADSGVAMPNGDFPIPDEGHLKSAIGRLGNYTGDKAAAKQHIIKRARSLGLADELPETWGVTKMTMDFTEATSQTNTVHGDRQGPKPGDNSHNAGMPPAEPYSQPRPAEGNGRGDVSPEQEVPVDTALSHTNAVARKADGDGDADDKPGAPEAANDNDADDAKKEIIDMTADELTKLLDERDARLVDSIAAKMASATAQGQEPATEEAAPAAKSATDTAEAVDIAAVVTAAVKAVVEPMEKRLADMEKEPVHRPMLNASGVEAGAQAPVLRGAEGTTNGDNFFKALEDKVKNAVTPQQRQRYASELLMAKSIVAERQRENSPGGPNQFRAGTPLIVQPAHAIAAAAADRG